MGGICIATRTPFPHGSAVRIVLHARSAPLAVAVKGLWQQYEPSEKLVLTGFEFAPRSKADRKRIADLVADSVQRIAEVLRHTRLPELGLGDAMAVAEIVRFRSVRAGHVVYGCQAQSHHAASIFVVEGGRVSLHLAGAGSQRVEVALVEKGGLFGNVSPDSPPLREVAVAECDTQLLEIHDGMIEHLRRHQPQLAFRLASATFRAASLRHRAALLAATCEPAIGRDARPAERGASGIG